MKNKWAFNDVLQGAISGGKKQKRRKSKSKGRRKQTTFRLFAE